MADESKYPTRIAPYGLRMPDDLKARVQAAAEANNRSMNAEIVAVLEQEYPAPEAFQPFEFIFEAWSTRSKGLVADNHRSLLDEINSRLKSEGVGHMSVSLDDVGVLAIRLTGDGKSPS